MMHGRTKYRISHDTGFAATGTDKGCIILNIDADSGFKVLICRSNEQDG